MTIKQIAEAVGKDERTVQRWARKAADIMSSLNDKMSSSSPMRPADFDLDETVAIIEAGLGKNAGALFRENASRSATVQAAPEDRLSRLESIVEKLIGAVAVLLPAQAPAKPAQPALPSPPELSPRQDLQRLIRRGAKKHGGFREAWHELYEQYDLRSHRNLRLCAKNRGMDTLDYAEEEYLMGELLALAYQLFGGAA